MTIGPGEVFAGHSSEAEVEARGPFLLHNLVKERVGRFLPTGPALGAFLELFAMAFVDSDYSELRTIHVVRERDWPMGVKDRVDLDVANFGDPSGQL